MNNSFVFWAFNWMSSCFDRVVAFAALENLIASVCYIISGCFVTVMLHSWLLTPPKAFPCSDFNFALAMPNITIVIFYQKETTLKLGTMSSL